MHLRDSRLLAAFLSVFLLFVQQGATLHALSHATQEVREGSRPVPAKQSPAGHENCEQCLAFSAAGAGLLANHVVAFADFAQVATTASLVVQIPRRTTTAYHSRAPPFLIA